VAGHGSWVVDVGEIKKDAPGWRGQD
jgi:hypothetical protein